MVDGTPDDEYVGTIYGQQYVLMERAIATGMEVSNDAKHVEPLSAGAINKARPIAEAFNLAIGHTDDHHRKIEPSAQPDGQILAALAAAPRFYRVMASIDHLVRRGEQPPNHLEHCGWWWCHLGLTRLPKQVWENLSRALQTLQWKKVDPWSVDVALVGSLWHEMEHRAFEKSEFEKAKAGLTGVLDDLDGMSDAARLVRVTLTQLESALTNVVLVEGVGSKGGGTKDAGRRAALQQAAALGWGPAVVAAISVLAAADRFDDFDAHTAKIDATWRRLLQEKS